MGSIKIKMTTFNMQNQKDKDNKQPTRKISKHFTKEIQKTNKHKRRCSILLNYNIKIKIVKQFEEI